MSPDATAASARATLGRRWRVVRRDEPNGAITLSAEKGYSRETGNLNTVRTCGFHDHNDPSTTALQGSIVIK